MRDKMYSSATVPPVEAPMAITLLVVRPRAPGFSALPKALRPTLAWAAILTFSTSSLAMSPTVKAAPGLHITSTAPADRASSASLLPSGVSDETTITGMGK